MIREFSEEKRQEIFRLLDEIDIKDWKSFMEWCGSRKEEFGDWPDMLNVSAYTRYVDEYHEKVLEINEMTRQQVNTVFENVAEIDARYAARLREHREKVKEQIAIVKTMTEFMDSMSNGNPNMALLSGESVSKAVVRTAEGTELSGTSSDDAGNETNIYSLRDYFDSGKEFEKEEIVQILDGALLSGNITQDECDHLKELFAEMFELKEEMLTNATNEINETNVIKIQILYEEIEREYNRIINRLQATENKTNIYSLNDYFDSGEEFSEEEIYRILEGAFYSGDITQNQYDALHTLFRDMFDATNETDKNYIYELIEKNYRQIIERVPFNHLYINEIRICYLDEYFDSERKISEEEIFRILDGSFLAGEMSLENYNELRELFTKSLELERKIRVQYNELSYDFFKIAQSIHNQANSTANNVYYLAYYFRSGKGFTKEEILRICDDALSSGEIPQYEYNYLKESFTKMFDLEEEKLNYDANIQNIYEMIKCVTLCDPVVAYRGWPQQEGFHHIIQLDDGVYDPYNPYNVYNLQGDQQTDQQTGCLEVDISARNDIEPRGWFSYMNRTVDNREGYYNGIEGFTCTRDGNQLAVNSGSQEYTFQLVDDKWWMDENDRYLITVGPNVLLTEYGKDGNMSLNVERFAGYIGCRIDVILVNDNDENDILTLECVYGGDIKEHTADEGVYMTGRSFLGGKPETADGSIIEFIGKETGKGDNGIMSNYHVDLIIVYDNDNAGEVN